MKKFEKSYYMWRDFIFQKFDASIEGVLIIFTPHYLTLVPPWDLNMFTYKIYVYFTEKNY